jgi:hypothetical protein
MNWIFNFFNPPRYRIMEYSTLNGESYYHAEWRHPLFGWHALYEDGRSGLPSSEASGMFYKCQTEDQAGRRVNLHATKRGGKQIWSAP